MSSLKASLPWRRLLEVTWLLVQREFRGRYKHTRVGMLWAVLNPLLFLLIFYFVFKVVIKINIPDYASFVFIGILAWGWFQSSVMQAASSISANPGMVSQPGFPVVALPLVATVSNLLNLALSVPVLVAILVIEGAHPSLSLLALPLVLIAQFLLILSCAYIVAAFNVGFRDVEHILPIVLQLGYYVTPIFYAADHIPANYQWLFKLNPMFHIVDDYRYSLLAGTFPPILPLVELIGLSLVLLAVGTFYFRLARYRFLEDL